MTTHHGIMLWTQAKHCWHSAQIRIILLMTQNGNPLFLLMLIANANVPTVAVCHDTPSCATQLYRPLDDLMNPDTTLSNFSTCPGPPKRQSAAKMVTVAAITDTKWQVNPSLNKLIQRTVHLTRMAQCNTNYTKLLSKRYVTFAFIAFCLNIPLVYTLRGSLHDASFHIKQNTFMAVRPSYYMTTVCWRPWNRRRLKPHYRAEAFETATFFSSTFLKAVTTLMLMLAQVTASMAEFL